ncbi:anhydro-N-acetylmuramic acid kinase [Paraflavisolibacter sp. H34]|uniref:anhydro-N-acetylmuramic acid kinase n=1 Tax=Huijunlia imazamoxiresistens TaxID=3127457 RepID=UPI003017A7D3
MVYKVIGLMSGSSLDGLDIVYTELHENGGNWSFEILASACYPYDNDWKEALKGATALNALDYQLLHTAYGHYLGSQVNRFIEEHNLHYQVALIASHGHTTFHLPAQKMTAQLGDGAALAAATGLPVVSDLRALDVAFGGQGAPIVPIGEKLLFRDYDLFLNIGGIANISFKKDGQWTAFDICPANRVLNLLAAKHGKDHDPGGSLAALGQVNEGLLQMLNELEYYRKPAPKSLSNSFGTDEVYPLIRSFGLTHNDSLRTYVEHIVGQVTAALALAPAGAEGPRKLLVTGGGALNTFLVDRLREAAAALQTEIVVADELILNYKEALVMALMGVLRWRQEYNTLSSATGAERDSIGGAVWIGQEA